MRCRFSSTWEWFRFEEPACYVEEKCELGTRTLIWPMVDVIRYAANSYLGTQPIVVRWWGQDRYPRLTYHGSS